MLRIRRGLLPVAFAPLVALTLVTGCGKPAMEGDPQPAESLGGDGSSGDVLTVGSMAPPLDVEHWFGDAERPVVTSFRSGDVYVVEFWATWCGPCVASMPHLAELQEEYADEGVTLISISDEDAPTVNAFLEQPIRGADGEDLDTYADLTSAYRLTADPDRSAYEDYMSAAGQSGIPTAFLVGKQGVIEWIGHPMRLDGPLQQVVNGTWDRDAFAEEFRREQEEALRRMRERQRISGEMQRLREASESGDDEAVDAILAQWAASDDEQLQRISADLERRFAVARFMTNSMANPEKAAEAFPKVIAQFQGDAQELNQFTWNLAQMAMADQLTDPTIIRLAAKATEAALDPNEPEGSLLDTIAHLYAELGELDTAIAFQERAVAAGQAPDDAELQAAIESYLVELRELKAAGDAPQAESELEQEPSPAPREAPEVAAEPTGGDAAESPGGSAKDATESPASDADPVESAADAAEAPAGS